MAFRQLMNRVSWALFKRETVGFDAKGNKYYRLLDKTVDGEIIERRMVKYSGDWDPAEIGPEWLQWLRKVRAEPPTSIEMQAGETSRQAHRDRADMADAAAAEAAMRYQQSGGGGSNSGSQVTQQLQQQPPKK
jgi:NADH:ubiquinone oxidoreductase subunit